MKQINKLVVFAVITIGLTITAIASIEYGKEVAMLNMESKASYTVYDIDECSLVDAIDSEEELDIGISAPKKYSEAVKAQLTEPCTVKDVVRLFLVTDPGYAERAVEKFGDSVLLEK